MIWSIVHNKAKTSLGNHLDVRSSLTSRHTPQFGWLYEFFILEDADGRAAGSEDPVAQSAGRRAHPRGEGCPKHCHDFRKDGRALEIIRDMDTQPLEHFYLYIGKVQKRWRH